MSQADRAPLRRRPPYGIPPVLDRPSALDYSGYSNGSGTAAGPVGHSLDTYGDHVYAAGNPDKFNTIRELFKTSPYVRKGEAVFVDGKSPGRLTNLTLTDLP